MTSSQSFSSKCRISTSILAIGNGHHYEKKKNQISSLIPFDVMDGLSAAASGIAVVSIAIQMTDSIQKVSDFIESIQEAPEDMKSTFSELQILSSLLKDIRLQNPLLSTNSSAQAVLESLEQKISSFMDLVNRYKPGLNSRSTGEKVECFQSGVETREV